MTVNIFDYLERFVKIANHKNLFFQVPPTFPSLQHVFRHSTRHNGVKFTLQLLRVKIINEWNLILSSCKIEANKVEMCCRLKSHDSRSEKLFLNSKKKFHCHSNNEITNWNEIERNLLRIEMFKTRRLSQTLFRSIFHLQHLKFVYQPGKQQKNHFLSRLKRMQHVKICFLWLFCRKKRIRKMIC